MKVFKFGGASVKDAESIRNVVQILSAFNGERLVVVVSAMGKSTNALEHCWKAVTAGQDWRISFSVLKENHLSVYKELMGGKKPSQTFANAIEGLQKRLEKTPVRNSEFLYDQIISYGELLSTLLISDFLHHSGVQHKWVDARKCILTNSNYREGIVDWATTIEQINDHCSNENTIFLTQGFIAANAEGMTTTLGREGSDYSAAIFANALDAEKLVVWKDVPGILSGDPRKFKWVEKLDFLSYEEAMKLTYHGAKVIHPKTVKPILEKQIPLAVRSFQNPHEPGTLVSAKASGLGAELSFIVHLEKLAVIELSLVSGLPVSEADLAEVYSCCANTYNHICLSLREANRILLVAERQSFRFNRLAEQLARFSIQVFPQNGELFTWQGVNEEFNKTLPQRQKKVARNAHRKTRAGSLHPLKTNCLLRVELE